MNWKEPKVYAVKHKNLNVRMSSRSGGIFSALSDYIFDCNGVVYGCVLTDNFQAVHVRAERPEERDYMRGSKYIQSSMGDIFVQVQRDLEVGKRVLFSGTSCQIDGLKKFLRKEYLNLLCVDIVCHGVPSPLVWEKYVEWCGIRNNGKVIAVDFRNKQKYGWGEHVETLKVKTSDEKVCDIDSRIFTKMFYDHSILRPCCYKCPYKSTMHPGDITIADYWGIDKAAPGFNDDKGVSLVLLNNEQGMEYFSNVQKSIEVRQTKLQDSMQPPFIGPFEQPEERNEFWNDFYKCSFDKIVKKYGTHSRVIRLKKKAKRLLKNML